MIFSPSCHGALKLVADEMNKVAQIEREKTTIAVHEVDLPCDDWMPVLTKDLCERYPVNLAAKHNDLGHGSL